MNTSEFEQAVSFKVDEAVEKARRAGINITNEQGQQIVRIALNETVGYFCHFSELPQGLKIVIEERLNHLPSEWFYPERRSEIRVYVHWEDRIPSDPISVGYRWALYPPKEIESHPPDRKDRIQFKKAFLPALDVPRNIKSKISEDFYQGGVTGLVCSIERHLGGSLRIKAHLLAIVTVMSYRDLGLVRNYELYRKHLFLAKVFDTVADESLFSR